MLGAKAEDDGGEVWRQIEHTRDAGEYVHPFDMYSCRILELIICTWCNGGRGGEAAVLAAVASLLMHTLGI